MRLIILPSLPRLPRLRNKSRSNLGETSATSAKPRQPRPRRGVQPRPGLYRNLCYFTIIFMTIFTIFYIIYYIFIWHFFIQNYIELTRVLPEFLPEFLTEFLPEFCLITLQKYSPCFFSSFATVLPLPPRVLPEFLPFARFLSCFFQMFSFFHSPLPAFRLTHFCFFINTTFASFHFLFTLSIKPFMGFLFFFLQFS